MDPIFELNHEMLTADPRFTEIEAGLSELSPIDSEEAFNHYCQAACRLWSAHLRKPLGKTSTRFTELLERIQRRSGSVIETAWGGVVVTLHEPPRVEKFLAIRQGRYLALEKHEEKDERIEVTEGAGLILWRRMAGQPLAVQTLLPGVEIHLEPGKEHCVIGTEDLLLFERSIDPKGMDQDLIFIYEPDGS